MQNLEKPYDVHVFVCTKKKEGKECCAAKNSESLWQSLKAWAASKPEWRGHIRINASGCLDHCTQGIAIAIYPQGEWIIEAKPEDEAQIRARIEQLMKERGF